MATPEDERYVLSLRDLRYLLGQAAWLARMRWQDLAPFLTDPGSEDVTTNDGSGWRAFKAKEVPLYLAQRDAVVNEVLAESDTVRRLKRHQAAYARLKPGQRNR